MTRQDLLKSMRLAVDASVLVAELLRLRGRALIAHPRLELFLTAEAFDETEFELRRRVARLERHGQITLEEATQLLHGSLDALTNAVSLVPSALYTDKLEEAGGVSFVTPTISQQLLSR